MKLLKDELQAKEKENFDLQIEIEVLKRSLSESQIIIGQLRKQKIKRNKSQLMPKLKYQHHYCRNLHKCKEQRKTKRKIQRENNENENHVKINDSHEIIDDR